MGLQHVDWTHTAEDRGKWRALANSVMNLLIPKNSGLSEQMRNQWVLKLILCFEVNQLFFIAYKRIEQETRQKFSSYSNVLALPFTTINTFHFHGSYHSNELAQHQGSNAILTPPYFSSEATKSTKKIQSTKFCTPFQTNRACYLISKLLWGGGKAFNNSIKDLPQMYFKAAQVS